MALRNYAKRLQREMVDEQNKNKRRKISQELTKDRQYLTNPYIKQLIASAPSRAVLAPASGGIIVTKKGTPQFRTNRESTIVCNTELYSNLNFAAAGVYSVFNLAIIPGLPAWLAGLSDLYSKYRWRKARLIYVPVCPTSTPGQVGMALTYDRQDADPLDMQALSQMNRAVIFPPYAGYNGASMLSSGKIHPEAVYLDLDVSLLEKTYYNVIQPATLTALANAVQTSYVPATVKIGHEGGPLLATRSGTLYIQYEIEFIEPCNPVANV
jgi:hypothetical protein